MSSNHQPALQLEKQGAHATLWIDHPTRRNALTFEMWASIPERLAEAGADPDIRVLILRGKGDQAFCAGADISQFGDRRSTEEGVRLWNSTVQASVDRLAAFPKPVVALISGYCFGGGVGLAMHCDMRYVIGEASFSIPAARLGLAYYPVWLQRLVSLVGPSVAKEIMFTAGRYTADEARSVGLIDAILTEEAAMERVAAIASLAPMTHYASKLAIDAAAMHGTIGARQCEEAVMACFRSDDYQEGQRAFAQKRPADFRGR